MSSGTPLDRRRFLQLAAGGAAATAGAAVLGSGSVAQAATRARLTSSSTFSLAYQLSWLKTVEFAGSYIADTKGYYKAHGLDVDLLAGGPNVDGIPLVTNGKAFVTTTGLDQASQAINQGAPIKVVAVLLQKNPFCVVSRADNPIRKPTDCYGKKIGVAASNSTAWNAFVSLNNLDVSKIHVEPAQFDPTPVATGEFDGQVVFIDNEVIQLQEKGLKTATMLFEDFNYHLVTDVYAVNTSTLADATKRAALVSFLKAEIQGWKMAIANPKYAASLTVNDYGKGTGLDLKQQIGEATTQIPLINDAYTKKHGLLYFTSAALAPDFKTLKASKIVASPSKVLDDTVIADVYK